MDLSSILKTMRRACIATALSASSLVASSATCDRSCLLKHAEQFNADMLAHTPAGTGDDGCYESNLGPKPWGPATETRIAVVDPERGIVVGYAVLCYGSSTRRMQINEVFKILDGRIRMVDNIGLMEEGITTSGFTH